MARHPFGPMGKRKARNRTYTVLALLAVVVVIAFMYGPWSADAENEGKPVESGYPADFNTDLGEPDANEIVVAEQPRPSAPAAIVPEPEIVVMPEPELEIVIPEPDVPQIAVEPEVGVEGMIAPNPEADVLIAKAAGLIAQGNSGIIEARDSLNQTLRMPMSPKQRDYVKAQLTELSNLWLFSKTIFLGDPLCQSYRVPSGGIFETIGKQHKVPYEILMDINKIKNARSLQAGQAIKVVNGPFHAKVYRSTFTMDLYLQNTYVRSFSVGLGKPGYETPRGLWRLRPGGKAHETEWRDPDTGRLYQPEDPDYPLGSRWMALDGLSGEAKGRDGFGIHGTIKPEQIGTAGSRGCIRMYNGQAIMVYNMLIDGLSQVEVTD